MRVSPAVCRICCTLAALVIVGAVSHPLIARQAIEERVVIQGPGPGSMPFPPRDVMPGPRAAEQPTGTAVLDGVVISADLGRPVRRATVRLSPVVPGPPRSTTSDDAGRFRFESVPAGQFLVSASKPGYLESTYGQRQPGSGQPGTPVSVASGQRIDRLVLPIARGGVLAGSVADDGGEPAFGTEVQAYRFVWSQGERTLRLAGRAVADDRGNFRVGALPPGEYLVMATPVGKSGVFDDFGFLPKLRNAEAVSSIGMVRPSSPSADGTSTDYAPVFYPGTTSSANAMRVTIGISEERSGLDIQLPLVAMTRVEGVVMNEAGPAPGTEVRLIDLDMPIEGLGLKSTATGPDGRFAFDDVAPGRYRLQARSGPMTQMIVDEVAGERRVMMQFSAARVGPDAPGAVGFHSEPPASDVRWAAADVTLVGSRSEPITLTLQPGVRVSGRLTFEGPDQAPSDLSMFRVVLSSARPGQDGMSSSIGQLDANGRFAVDGVTPGVYRVSVLSSSNWRVKSFDVGGRDALDFLLTVPVNQEVPAADVTLTTRSSTLSGTLLDGTGRPAPAHTIIVFPEDPGYWVSDSRRIRATRPSTDGRYSVTNLPSGNYRLVAVDDLEDGQWSDPDVLKQLIAAALPISIGDAETKVQDLRIAGN